MHADEAIQYKTHPPAILAEGINASNSNAGFQVVLVIPLGHIAALMHQSDDQGHCCAYRELAGQYGRERQQGISERFLSHFDKKVFF